MDKIYEKFDSYINGVLEGDELRTFEEALKKDHKLMEYLTLYREADAVLQGHFENKGKRKRLEETLSALNKEYFNEEKQEAKVVKMKPRSKMLKWAVAAVVLLLASFFIPRLFTAPTPSFASLVEMPTASLTEMGVDADQNILAEAEKAFNNKNYSQVIATLKPYVNRHPDNTTTVFYLALANLEADNLQEAEAALKTISQGQSAYASEAIWYLALLELKQGNEEQFRAYLKQIPKGSQHYEVAKRYR